MPKQSYAEKLKDPRWQKKRLEVLERDGFKCRECKSAEKTLHVHHSYYQKGLQPWEYPDDSLWTLCEECHKSRDEQELSIQQILSTFTCSQLDSLRCDYLYACSMCSVNDMGFLCRVLIAISMKNRAGKIA